MRHFGLSTLLALTVATSACTQVSTPLKTPQPEPTRPTEQINKRKEWLKDLAALESTPSSALDFDVRRYNAVLEYLPSFPEARLKGYVDVEFRALAALSSLKLNANVQSIHKVEDASGEVLEFSYTRDARSLQIQLARPLAPQEETLVRVHYSTLANDPASWGLYLYNPQPEEDPIAYPMLYTKTEPQGTMGWMPSQDRPDDRAALALEITLPRELALVANGLLVKDHFTSRSRTMKWETEIPISTYLMAFAVSKFQHTSQWHEGLELSIWSRQGLPLDAHALLEETRRQLALFESLMVP